MDPAQARAVWRQLETIHAVAYFTPACRAAMEGIGLRGFWMGYFAQRAAPMGAVAPGVVEATFYNFHPAMVRRALPDAWDMAAPDVVVPARAASAAAVLERLADAAGAAGAAVVPLVPLVALLRRAIGQGDGAGRVLFAANRAVDAGEGYAGLWQAATTLREHRGDGHVAVLTEAEIDGCAAHVLFSATGGGPAEIFRANRGWSTDEWAEATDRLSTRGLMASPGTPTPAGRALHDAIERRTDELALTPYRALTDDEWTALLGGVTSVADAIRAARAIPYPNPMGLPAS